MKSLNRVPESSMKIRFHDCDPFNHLNNSRYIDYIVAARGDQLIDHYDFNIYKLAKEKGLGWVTAQTQISYFAPALLMEEVTIQTRLLIANTKSLLFEGIMWSYDKTTPKALMWLKLVHFNLVSQKSISHSDEFMAFFDKILYPVEGVNTFEERIGSIREMAFKPS